MSDVSEKPMGDKSKRKVKPRTYRELWNRPGYLIRRLHQIHLGLFAEECQEFEVTPVQFGMLSVLATGSDMDQLTLSTSVGVDRVSGADVIKRLEKRKLLERKISDQDRRARVIRITETGRKFVKRVRPKMAHAQTKFVSPLTDEERAEFERIMKKLINANNKASRAPLGSS